MGELSMNKQDLKTRFDRAIELAIFIAGDHCQLVESTELTKEKFELAAKLFLCSENVREGIVEVLDGK